MAYSVQMLEGLLVEAERWSEAFELLKGDPAACARVANAYVAWLLAQHRPLDAYRTLRCTSSAYQMQMSCTFLCEYLWESMHKMAVNKDVHTRHDRRRQPNWDHDAGLVNFSERCCTCHIYVQVQV